MISFKIHANKEDVLKVLRDNLVRHKQIVAEAKEGFLKEAERLLTEKLAVVKAGKIKVLSVGLSTPADYSYEYETAIKMLELSIEPTLEMTTEMVQCYMEDRWQWQRQFTTTNSAYSVGARNMLDNSEE